MFLMDFPEELKNVDWMTKSIADQTDIISSVEDWYSDFKLYYHKSFLNQDYISQESGKYVLYVRALLFRSCSK